MYKIDEKSQYFLPGTEGTEAITHIALSADGKYISVCERSAEGQKGIVSIYDIISSRPMQSLPDAPDQSKMFQSQEMVCSAFSPIKEEIIVTLCGAPDWQILLWDWNKKRLLHSLPLGLNIPQQVHPNTFQLSFNPFDREGHSILLTGPCNTYKYIKKDIDNIMATSLTQLISADQARKISQNFTCHAWSQQTG